LAQVECPSCHQLATLFIKLTKRDAVYVCENKDCLLSYQRFYDQLGIEIQLVSHREKGETK